MKRILFVLILCLSTRGFAQSPLVIHMGARGGVFLQAPPIEAESNHYFPPSFNVDRTLFSVGTSGGAVLYDKVDVRFEAVHSSFKFHGTEVAGPSSSTWTTTGSLWQFPLIATYRFGSGAIRPFAGGGLGFGSSVRGTTVGTQIIQFPGQPQQINSLNGPYRTFSNPSIYYISAGFEDSMPLISIRPEFRYSRWGQFSDQENATLNSRNQIELVIGISFHAFRSR